MDGNDIEVESDLPVFHGDIYITRVTSEAPAWSDSRFDIHNGCRPDVRAIVQQTADRVRAVQDCSSVPCDSRVAVLACGPSMLVETTKRACWQHSATVVDAHTKGGVVFDFHEEVFDY